MMRCPRLPLLASLAALAMLATLAESRPDDQPVGPVPIEDQLDFPTAVIENPTGNRSARFGHSVCALDLDGDGALEVAVGANRETAVYVMKENQGAWEHELTYGAAGVILQPPLDGSEFGHFMVGADFDADGADELVVSAPETEGILEKGGAVYVFGLTGGDLVLLPTRSEEGLFGRSLAVGDFDHDGALDLAVSAPLATVAAQASAGRVVLFLGPLGPQSEKLVLDNPDPAVNGSFGHDLAVCDWDEDGRDDLVVSAIGNTVGGQALAGNVYVFPGPVAPSSHFALNDPAPIPGDLPRYGMSIDASGREVAVGSPRKDHGGVTDTGLGSSFVGPTAIPILHAHPQPFEGAILGFRVLYCDLIGDAKPELAVASLPAEGVPPDGGNPDLQTFQNRGLYIWPSGGALPPKFQPADEDSESHFCTGIDAAQLVPGGHEELILGDPTWDAPGTGRGNNTGRVVIYFPPE